MKNQVDIIREALLLIKALPESDAKTDALLSLNILLGDTIIHSDWVSSVLNLELEKAFTI